MSFTVVKQTKAMARLAPGIPPQLGSVRSLGRASLYVQSVFLANPDLMANKIAVFYYLSFPSDMRRIKCLVCFVFLIETAQTVVMTSDCFNAYANSFGSPKLLTKMQNEWLAVPVFTAIGWCLSLNPLVRDHSTEPVYSELRGGDLLCIPAPYLVGVQMPSCLYMSGMLCRQGDCTRYH